MAGTDMIMYEEEFQQIRVILQKLKEDSHAKMVFLVDKNGQQIAYNGDINNLDTTSLAYVDGGQRCRRHRWSARLIVRKSFSVLFP